MEEIKRGRGRPRLDTRYTEAHAPSRRQAVNSMYMFEAVQLISEAATEIPDSELLWYSDNASFMQLSQKYETERDELKLKIRQYQEELSEIENLRTSKEQFTFAVRKFMQMETLTPALLNELIEKIEVHSIEGKGKNKTQRIVIHYRFIGVIENPVKEENIVLEARQGVAVEYLTA